MQISVVIPAYNAGQLIEETLESVYAQTYPPYEVIVVDDGSLDDTQKKVEKFLARHHSLTYIRQSNSGVAKARNVGIQVASGSWLAFMDADDLWIQTKLETQVKFLKDNPHVDHLSAHATPFEGGKDRTHVPDSGFGHRGNGVVEHAALLLTIGNPIITSSVMIRKSSVSELGGFDESLVVAEDHELWLRLAMHGYIFAYQHQKLVRKRIHEHNLSRNIALYKQEQEKFLPKKCPAQAGAMGGEKEPFCVLACERNFSGLSRARS